MQVRSSCHLLETHDGCRLQGGDRRDGGGGEAGLGVAAVGADVRTEADRHRGQDRHLDQQRRSVVVSADTGWVWLAKRVDCAIRWLKVSIYNLSISQSNLNLG